MISKEDEVFATILKKNYSLYGLRFDDYKCATCQGRYICSHAFNPANVENCYYER